MPSFDHANISLPLIVVEWHFQIVDEREGLVFVLDQFIMKIIYFVLCFPPRVFLTMPALITLTGLIGGVAGAGLGYQALLPFPSRDSVVSGTLPITVGK